MTDVTDEMVGPAVDVVAARTTTGGFRVCIPTETMRAALAAALAAAPAVDGWFWCGRLKYPTKLDDSMNLWSCQDPHDSTPCPGPHRVILLGPEVQA